MNLKSSNPTFRKNKTRKHILLSKRVMMCFLFCVFRGVFMKKMRMCFPREKTYVDGVRHSNLSGGGFSVRIAYHQEREKGGFARP